MRVFLEALNMESDAAELLRERARHSAVHQLVEEPSQADLIVFVGNVAYEPRALLEHALLRSFPHKCAVYCEDDNYVPFLNGVYCSATVGIHTRLGRVYNHAYVTGTGRYLNPFTEGVPDEHRSLLFSFQGASTSLLRKWLFRIPFKGSDVLIEDTSSYSNWSMEQERRDYHQRRYADTIKRSHFVLCPRGAGAGSIRLFEVMRMGVAPVLISDGYALPPDVDWDSFLVRVKERDLPRLREILVPLADTAKLRGQQARKAWVQHFDPAGDFERIVELCARSQQHAGPPERVFRAFSSGMALSFLARAKARKSARQAIITAFRLAGRSAPFGVKP